MGAFRRNDSIVAKPLAVWLVTSGEPIGTDGDARLLRTGLQADALTARGVVVTWWTSRFDHASKQHRRGPDVLATATGATIRLLESRGYRQNVSVERLLDHRQAAASFHRRADREEVPDIVIASMPTIDLALAAVRYGRARGVPVLIDIRDLWPDVFVDRRARWTRIAVTPLLAYWRAQVAEICQGASGLMAPTREYLDWGLCHAERDLSPNDLVLPFSAPRTAEPNPGRWGWSPEVGPLFAFVGTVGWQFDFETLVRAFRELRNEGYRFRVVIAGDGERLQEVRRLAGDMPQIEMPGRLDRGDLYQVLAQAHVGLAPYQASENFARNIPNKVIEYFAFGMPVIAGLNGAVGAVLCEHGVGRSYSAGNHVDCLSILRSVVASPGEWSDMAERARRLFDLRYSQDVVAARLLAHVTAITSAART